MRAWRRRNESGLRERRARGQRGERITQQLRVRALAAGMFIVQVNELAELVDVLDRMLERRPPGEQQGERKESRG